MNDALSNRKMKFRVQAPNDGRAVVRVNYAQQPSFILDNNDFDPDEITNYGGWSSVFNSSDQWVPGDVKVDFGTSGFCCVSVLTSTPTIVSSQ